MDKPPMLRPDPATLRAVEAAAEAAQVAIEGECDGLAVDRQQALRIVCHVLAAYHAALGETVRVTRVERCLQDGKEEGA